MRIRGWIWSWTVCLALGALAACGGGGGGDGGGGGGGGNPSTLTIGFSTNRLDFGGVEGAPITAQSVVATARGTTSDPIFVGAEVLQGTALALPIQVTIDTGLQQALIAFQPRSDLAAGTHTGRVRLLACADANCARHYPGSPFDVSYTIVVAPRLSFPNETSAGIAAAESTTAPDRTVAVRLPAAGTTLAVAITYQQGTGWLQAQQTTQGLLLRASAVGLTPGTYNAQVQIEGGQPLQAAVLPVQFAVSTGLVVAPVTDVTLQTNSPFDVVHPTILVGMAPGVVDGRWQATVDQPWLEVTIGSGTAGDPSHTAIGLMLDRSAVGALANRQTHVAHITVSSPGGLAPQTVELRLHKDLAEIDSADALALLSETPGDVLLYGHFPGSFDLSPYVSGFGFGPVVERLGTSVLKLRATAQSFDRVVTTTNDAGVPTRVVTLKVLPIRDYPAAAVPTTAGAKGPLMYDPVTRGLYTVDRDASSLMRFGFDGATTWITSTQSIPDLANFGLMIDRTRLVTLNTHNAVDLRDPTTLQPLKTFVLTGEVASYAPSVIALTISGDARLWFGTGRTTLSTLNLDTGVQDTVPGTFDFYNGPWGLVTRNGRQLLFTQSLSVSPAPPMLSLDLADGIAKPLQLPGYNGFARISQSRNGSRTATEAMDVWDDQWQTLGRITLPTKWVAMHAMMSRDGSRAYVYAQHEDSFFAQTTPLLPRVFVLDTSGTQASQADLPIIGNFDLTQYPACVPSQNNCQAFSVQTVLADDDRTVFAVGDRFLVVQPVPPDLLPPAPSLLRIAPAAATGLKRLR